jgi:hypothetical protein
VRRTVVAALAALATVAAPASAAALPAATVHAREHFFGAANVDAAGHVRRDRAIFSWFSVGSLAAALDGHVVLLDTYIHKGEDKPNYVPTTTDELVALAPEAVFLGHGHFDHANTAGQVVARTGALLIGTPEHCDQTKAQAANYAGEPVNVHCVTTVPRGALPGARAEIAPLGPGIGVTVLRHLHSAFEPPDAEHLTNPSLLPPPLVDPSLILMHPPGPSVVNNDPNGDEGGSLLYQFRVGGLSVVWHDTAGPMREEAPQLVPALKALPRTDVELGAVLGFNGPTNGARDPVDYIEALRPKVFYPLHHDFVQEYGASRQLETVMRREMARRGDLEGTELRWLYDPYDYVRPSLATFPVTRTPAPRGRGTSRAGRRTRGR